jgi:hypothetical protein
MPYANVVAPFESFVKDKYPNLNVEQVVELHDYVRFVLTDEGDFDGLSKFVKETGRDFKAQVELRRESTKSFQLEVTVPKKTQPQLSDTAHTVQAWLATLMTSLSFVMGTMYLVSLFRP